MDADVTPANAIPVMPAGGEVFAWDDTLLTGLPLVDA